MRQPFTVLWWVPAGHRPTVIKAKERLIRLRAAGPSPDAFTSQHPFPAPGSTTPARSQDAWFCEADRSGDAVEAGGLHAPPQDPTRSENLASAEVLTVSR